MENQDQPKKKKTPMIIGLIVVAFLVIFGGMKLIHAMRHESTDNAQVESNTVPIISRLAGYVANVYVKDYQEVKKGDTLITIDPSEYTLALRQAISDLNSAKADLANAEAQLVNNNYNQQVAAANLDLQSTRLEKAENDMKRDEALYKDNSITRKQFEDSRNNLESARKQLRSNKDQVALAQSQLTNAKAQIEKAKALIATKEAQVSNAELRMGYTTLIAPQNGRISKTNLQAGQYVQPGQSLFTLVNDDEFWVVANFKETQLSHLKEGMAATIKIDGYPDVKVTGKIASISEATGARFAMLPPDNSTGNFVKVTQRVPVKIALDSQDSIKSYLKAGLNVVVEVEIN